MEWYGLSLGRWGGWTLSAFAAGYGLHLQAEAGDTDPPPPGPFARPTGSRWEIHDGVAERLEYVPYAPPRPLGALGFGAVGADTPRMVEVADDLRFPMDNYDSSYVARPAKVRWAVVPYWLLVAAVLAWQVPQLARRLRAARERARGVCPACGYDLQATPDRCPECGREEPAATTTTARDTAGAGDGRRRRRFTPRGRRVVRMTAVATCAAAALVAAERSTRPADRPPPGVPPYSHRLPFRPEWGPARRLGPTAWSAPRPTASGSRGGGTRRSGTAAAEVGSSSSFGSAPT